VDAYTSRAYRKTDRFEAMNPDVSRYPAFIAGLLLGKIVEVTCHVPSLLQRIFDLPLLHPTVLLLVSSRRV
jgi:hypothetical protein